MIWESWPWKCEIARRANELKRRESQHRWVEASYAQVEQDIFISAYAVRKLKEAFKISDEVESVQLDSEEFKPRERSVDIMNWHKLDELYNLQNGTPVKVSLKCYYNQIIHSYIFILDFKEGGGLSGFYVASDQEKANRLLYFSIKTVIDTLFKVAQDDIVYVFTKREAIGKPRKIVMKSNRLIDR